MDLAYIPSGVSSSTVGVDFFRCIRSSCYVVSGDSPEREELLPHTLNALLDSKTFWPDGTQVQTHSLRFSLAHYVVIFVNILSSSSSAWPGDRDPHLWVGEDAGVVPADRGQTEGAGHHRAGIQQHRRHARRNLPGLQDRVLKNKLESENQRIARKQWGHFTTKSFYRGKNCMKISDPWPRLRRQCLSANDNCPVANPAHMGLKVQCVHLVLRCRSGLCNVSWPNSPHGCHVYGKQYSTDQIQIIQFVHLILIILRSPKLSVVCIESAWWIGM